MRRAYTTTLVHFFLGVAGLSLFGVAGCDTAAKQGPPTTTIAANQGNTGETPRERPTDGSSGQVESPAAVEVTGPLTDDECQLFGQAIVNALNANDILELNRLIDWDTLFAKALDRLPAPDKLHENFIADADASLTQPEGFWPQIISQAGAGNPEIAHLLHVHGAGDKRAVLVRVVLPETVTYLDLTVARRHGKPCGVDIFSFLAGELLSHSLRHSYVSILAQQSPASVGELQGWERDLAENGAAIADLAPLLPKQPADWLKGYEKLPEKLRHQKNLMHTRVSAARLSSDADFTPAVADLKATFPGDPSVDLVLVDLYAEAQQYPETEVYLKKLDEEVGGDPYLGVWLANVMLAQGRREDARRVVQAAIQEEPSLRHGYWSLVMISLADQKFDETVKLLVLLEQKFQVEFDDFSKHAEYAEFIRSPQYQTWLKLRSAQVPATNSLR